MRIIIVIKGVTTADYQEIKADLSQQLRDKGVIPQDLPLFACLPGEYPEIEIVWIDAEMEKHHYALAITGTGQTKPSTIGDFQVMRQMAGA